MARHKDNVHICRVSCLLTEENYRKVKAFSRIAGKDVGFVIRNIIDNYVKTNPEKFDKALNVISEMDTIKADLCKI